MPVTDDELNTLAASLTNDHDTGTVSVACFAHIAISAVQCASNHHSFDAHSLLTFGRECLQAYAQQRGLAWTDLMAAMRAVRRAGRTARYLDTIPD